MPIINMVYKKKKGWKPNENTLLYLPLENDTADHSLYNRAITQSGTVTKADIGYLFARPGSGENALKCSDTIATLVGNFPYTVNMYGKMQTTGTSILYWSSVYAQNGVDFLINSSNNQIRVASIVGGTYNTIWYSINTIGSGWHNYVFIINSNKTEIYMDGSLVISHNYNQTLSTLAGGILQYPDTTLNTGMYWSRFFIEKGGWTQDDITKYFNQTKANYGL